MRTADVYGGVTPVALISSRQSTATVTGTGVDVTAYVGIGIATLNAGQATAGTAPTLDVTLEESDSSGSGYTAITDAAFTQVTDASGAILNSLALDFDKRKKYIRAVGTIAGTNTPTFQWGVVLSGRKQFS